MIVYAIKQLSTGWYLPYPKAGVAARTRAEFKPSAVPRLFSTKLNANNCLRFWLKGPLYLAKLTFTERSKWEDLDQLRKIPGSPVRDPADYKVVTLDIIEAD